MLRRVKQLRDLGRFTSFDHPTAAELGFRRLTLLFARNASGKTTLARVIAAAGSDAVPLAEHATLGGTRPPQVTLEFEGSAPVRFDGRVWSGPRPRILVFDRDFIESNVYVGRSPSKATRSALLEIALGADAKASQALDEISERGRKLTGELRTHAVAIRTAAEASGLSESAFIKLPQVADAEAERARLHALERRAIMAGEVGKRALPARLPLLAAIDLDGLDALLKRSAATIGDDAEAAVRAHLEGRLGGAALGWVRQGIRHDDGKTCPYCGQDTADLDLLRHYRGWFDAAWDRLATELDSAATALGELDRWWEQVKRVGLDNLKAYDVWSDLPDLTRPDLDSRSRRAELDRVKAGLAEVIAKKRSRLGDVVDGASALLQVRAALDSVRAAVRTYNARVDDSLDAIRAHCDALAGLSVDDARRDIRRLDAQIQRHGALLSSALADRQRLEREKSENDRAKAEAEAALKARSESKLEAFGDRINALLDDLCADFRIVKLGTERVGGAAAARFTLAVDLGGRDVRELPVLNKEGEQRLGRVLSDGDRSTLAMAVFLARLDDVADLGEHIVLFDDPMTSLDHRRSGATAEKVADVARKARQVLVLSHHAPFLAQVSHAWSRYGERDRAQLQEVELDRGKRTITTWKSDDHIAHEHIRRWREIHEFVADPTLDAKSRHIHGEIRAFLEDYVRLRWPDVFGYSTEALEPVIKRLRGDPLQRDSRTSLTADDLDRLDRLCGFGAGGNHGSGGRAMDPPEPEAVRRRAAQALEFARSLR